MKITTLFSKKVPGSEEYSSLGYHLQIEIEPPPDVQNDREKLRSYIERLFVECKARVEDQLDQNGGAERSGATKRQSEDRRPSRRPVPTQRDRSAFSHHKRNGGSARDGNGRSEPRNGNFATPKQLNFLRAIAQEQGLGYEGLQQMARDEFGTDDVLHLSRRQASQLIDGLLPKERE